MRQRLPNAFFLRVLMTGLLLGNGARAIGGVQGEKGRAAAPERAPVTTIPATRAEPVVPPSAAKSIASQLNDAYVSVFEHVAPAVVVIDVLKRSTLENDPDNFPDVFFQTPAPDKSGGTAREKDRGKGDKEKAQELFAQAAGFNSLPQLNYAFVRTKAQKMAGKKA